MKIIARLSGSWSFSDIAYCLFFVTFYAIFANVPFWAASHWLGIVLLGWFCLEYAVIGLLALFVPRILAVSLLLLVISADMLCGVSKTYYLAPTECLANIGALHGLPATRLLAVAAVGVLILLVSSIAAFFPVAAIRGAYRSYAAASLLAFVVLAVSVDCTVLVRKTGQAPNLLQPAFRDDGLSSHYMNYLWASRYPIIRLLRSERILGLHRNTLNTTPEDDSAVPSAAALAVSSAGLTAGKKSAGMPNLVIVLVESWGLAIDSSVRDSLVRPYSNPSLLAQYKVQQGTVPFYGPTVSGEARELCGNKMGFHLIVSSTQKLQGCLPDQLASLGYHSLALHGMDGHFFDRLTWYRHIGFQEQWFRDQFRQGGLPDCAGAFVGTCDASIAEWIGQRLAINGTNPDLVYWVTLNSHLPVPLPSQLANGVPCSLTPNLSQQPALCSWYQLIANVHNSVSKLAMTKLARPTNFVIVGDHAPPFSDLSLRNQFSDAVVPYVLLIPRQDNQKQTSARR
jgi:phosphoglycerol transferase MdoB-like AlkP superfamily enzyme